MPIELYGNVLGKVSIYFVLVLKGKINFTSMKNRKKVIISIGLTVCLLFLGLLIAEPGGLLSLALFPILYVGCIKNVAEISDLKENVNGEALRIRFIQENFKEHVEIEFNVEVQSKVRLSVYDMYGKLVKNLLNDDFKEGKHYLTWKSGSQIPSNGPFYFKMESGNMVEVKKLFYS